MNAKERLRAYLEQRRELGESEMVLDALEVDDVMRMLGALSGAPSPASEGTSAPAPSEPRALTPSPRAAPAPEREAAPPPERTVRDDDAAETGDWREVMRNLKSAAPARRDPVPAAPPPAAGAPAAEPVRPRGTLQITGLVVPLGLRVERPDPAHVNQASVQWGTLADVTAAIAACTGCALVQTATRPVPGVGDPNADVLVVGEAPGEKEDEAGEPFVGPAGQLLTKILGAIQLTRESVYICNVLKHRPPGNRNPLPEEVRACAPFLQRQIDLVQPRLILAFGTFAAQSLLGTKLALGKLRQQVHWYQGIPLIATYHPAALLRNDAWKRPTWEDVKLARRVLDATVRTDDQS